MSITYGFFNSLNSDRVYNADQMSEYFEGIISNGVCQNYKNALMVTADGSGMTVNVQSGRAYINSKWIKLDNSEELTITNAHVTLNRYTAVCIHLDVANRLMELVTIDGTPATSATRPTITSTTTDIYLVLAYVYVAASATAVSQENITDTRSNTSICGWVSGLIDSVDTETLFAQWEAVYSAAVADMQAWETSMKSQFDTWFSALTEDLNVNTYIEQYKKHTTQSTTDPIVHFGDISGYSWESSDIVNVYINGLLAEQTTDYVLVGSAGDPYITLTNPATGNDIDIVIYKSKIGF